MKIRKLKWRIFMLTIFSFLFSVAPFAVTVISRWGIYVQAPSDAIKLSVGGIMVLVLMFLKVIGRLKLPQKRIATYLFLLALFYALSNILNDLVLLIGMLAIGELIDLIIFQTALKKSREKLLLEKTGDAVSEKVETIVKKYLGGN